MSKKSIGVLIGVLLLLVVIVVGVVIKNGQNKSTTTTVKSNTAPMVINGLIGSEKLGLFQDPKFQKYVLQKYNVQINATKSGSLEMADRDLTGYDYIFPSSQVAEELIKMKKGKLIKHSQTVLNSPIVFMSWGEVTDAFVKQGIFKKENDTYYVNNTKQFIDLITQGKTWANVGLPDLYGNVSVFSTNPSKSNSGNMFAGLIANMANNGNVVDKQTLPTVLPQVGTFFSKLGYLESTSEDLFDQFLKTGVGAKPIIVGYENQLIEFAVNNPDAWKQVKDDIRIIYPTPTVWSEHPVMSLDDKGDKLIDILSDPEVQKIAWTRHGFRTGIGGAQNNPNDLPIKGVPTTIKSIIPMPTPEVMDGIVQKVQQ